MTSLFEIIGILILINTAVFMMTVRIACLSRLRDSQMRYSYATAQFVKAYLIHYILICCILKPFSLLYEYILINLICVLIFYLSLAALFINLRYKTFFSRKNVRTQRNGKDYINSNGNDKISQMKYEVPEKFLEENCSGLQTERFSLIGKLFTEKGMPSFLIKQVALPEKNAGGRRIHIENEVMNSIRDLNKMLERFYSEISLNGFLIVRYFPCSRRPVINFVELWKGYKRLSRAEMWGRLHYGGFEVINEIDENGNFFILAQKKAAKPERTKHPENLLLKLRRVGYKGNIFFVYKIRTMYPYSEFIQEKIFELNSLGNSGKISGDFRITPLGKILRKYWIDELPQLLNWIKGDIKLIGIRGMSIHYFSLYPEYFQRTFELVKPGLIPPLIDNGYHDFDSIVKTEYNYLIDYLESPVKTDWLCFFQTMKKIIFQGYRGN